MSEVVQNSTRKFKVFMVDATTKEPIDDLLPSDFTVYLNKPGLSDATTIPSIANRGHGWYEITPIAADRDTIGESGWTFTATGADPYPRLENVIAIDKDDPQRAGLGALPETDVASTVPAMQAVADDFKATGFAEPGDAMSLIDDAVGRDQIEDGAINEDKIAPNAIGASQVSNGAVAKFEGALLNDGDGSALLAAIVAAIDAADIDADLLPGLIVNALFDRVLAGNHETAGTFGRIVQDVLQHTGTAIPTSINDVPSLVVAAMQAVADSFKADTAGLSTHSAADVWAVVERTLTEGTRDAQIDAVKLKSDQMQFSGGLLEVIVHDFLTAALQQFITVDTGFSSAGTRSVAAISQGSGGGGGGGGPVTIDYGEISASLALTLSRLVVKASTLSSVDHVVARGTTWRIPIEELPAAWTKVEITARSNPDASQSSSLFHVRLSNPTDAEDGLQVFAGSGDVNASDGEIDTLVDPPVCNIAAALTADAESCEYCYDVKVWEGEAITRTSYGLITVEKDVTRT